MRGGIYLGRSWLVLSTPFSLRAFVLLSCLVLKNLTAGVIFWCVWCYAKLTQLLSEITNFHSDFDWVVKTAAAFSSALNSPGFFNFIVFSRQSISSPTHWVFSLYNLTDNRWISAKLFLLYISLWSQCSQPRTYSFFSLALRPTYFARFKEVLFFPLTFTFHFDIGKNSSFLKKRFCDTANIEVLFDGEIENFMRKVANPNCVSKSKVILYHTIFCLNIYSFNGGSVTTLLGKHISYLNQRQAFSRIHSSFQWRWIANERLDRSQDTVGHIEKEWNPTEETVMTIEFLGYNCSLLQHRHPQLPPLAN